MAQKDTKADKPTTVELPKEVLSIKKSVKPDAFEQLGSGGMAGVISDALKQQEFERLKKKAIDIGMKAYDKSMLLQKGFHFINTGLIPRHTRIGDTLEFTETFDFTPEQSKLLKEVVEFNTEFKEAVDKAYTATTEEAWDAVQKKFKALDALIKRIEDITGKKLTK